MLSNLPHNSRIAFGQRGGRGWSGYLYDRLLRNESAKQGETCLHVDLRHIADKQFEGDTHVDEFLRNQLGEAQYKDIVMCLEMPGA